VTAHALRTPTFPATKPGSAGAAGGDGGAKRGGGPLEAPPRRSPRQMRGHLPLSPLLHLRMLCCRASSGGWGKLVDGRLAAIIDRLPPEPPGKFRPSLGGAIRRGAATARGNIKTPASAAGKKSAPNKGGGPTMADRVGKATPRPRASPARRPEGKPPRKWVLLRGGNSEKLWPPPRAAAMRRSLALRVASQSRLPAGLLPPPPRHLTSGR